MYASSGGHETVCREDEERILCKCLINNVLQRPHDRVGTTARLGCNDCTIGLQRPHVWASTTARFRLNERSISGKRAHVATALKVSH